MAIYNQLNFQNGNGTINAGIVGSERQPAIGMYSFVPPNGSWINASSNGFIDGYAKTYRSDGFTFPIGDNNAYRPAAISTAGSAGATAAYFGVDPGTATTSNLNGGTYGVLPAGGPFPTSAVATPTLKVDNVEYWDIDGATAARITLTWDANTPISSITNGVLSTLTIAGWNPATAKWEAIPSVFDATSLVQNTSTSTFTGPASTVSAGSITTSAAIVPITYTVYTLAGIVSVCPTITNVAANNTNPTTCAGANGSFQICGLTAATSYSLTYSKNGAVQTGVTQTANASGCLTVNGLTAGTYTGIRVYGAACTAGSNALGPITLFDPGSPAAPVLAMNPASGVLCIGQSLVLTASGASGSTFTYSGPGLSATTGASVTATPPAVGSTVYTVSQSLAGCTSPVASRTVTITAQPAISNIAPTNPTSCSGTNGSLALYGLSASTAYAISYSQNGGAAATQTVTTDASGVGNLTGLRAGAYSNIIASANGCSSAPQTATLSDPGAPAAPTLALSAASGNLCLGQSLTLTASGASGSTFTYSGPGLSATTGASVTATPTAVGSAVYTVTQRVSGCTSAVVSQTVTVNAQPTVTSIAATNPTSCSGTSGSLALNGLTPSASYTVSYSQNGGAAMTQTVVANTSGVASLTGLRAGAYSNIIASANGCSSAPQTATLSDPGAPSAPTLALSAASGNLCLGQSLTLTASGASGSTFTYSGPGLSATTGASVTATPPAVGSVVYTVSQSVSGCSSSVASQTVTVNAQPTVTSITPTNPSACGTSTGSISLNGLAPSSTFTVGYTRNGGTATTATVNSNGAGQLILNGLSAGTYTGISVAQGGCTSAPSSGTVTLTDPTPAALTATQVTAINPTSCGSTTGRIEITGLPASTGSIIVGYAKNGTPATATVSTDASGKATIQNLAAGTYTDFTIQTGSCASAPYAGPVSINDPGVTPLTAANITSINPTNCGNNDGRITLSGLPAQTTMTITYQANGSPASVNVTTNASGQAVIPSLTAGSYSVIAYTIGSCTSSPFNGTVVINDPGITPLTSTNVTGKAPTFCGGSNGRIDITGLAANQQLTINYKKDGVAQPAVSAISNGSGQVTVGNLTQGNYTAITYTIGACTSTSYTGSINMQQPELAASQFTGINPAVCGSNSGRIEITGLGSNQSLSINYTQNGTSVSVAVTTDASGKGIISGLLSGTYTAFSYSQGACSSTTYAGPIFLSNPAPTVLASSNVLGINPTQCGQTNGRIEITGLAASVSTTINYRRNNLVQAATVTSDANGKAIISGLNAGTYSDFTYTQGTCSSAPYVGPVTLTDPTPTALTAANVTPFNPTSCTATDGRIDITGLASNITTALSYAKDGVVTSVTLVSDASGKTTLSNLGTGNYSNFSYSQGACTSAPYTVTLAVSALGCSRIAMRVYLQGALFSSGGALSAANTPLMRDNLRLNGYLPLSDPYRTATYSSAFRQVNNAEFQTIPASMTATTGDKAIVDWVFIELRDKSNPVLVSYTRSGLLLRDGTVIDTDGQSSLNFTGIPTDNYYVAVRHRNHLGVMTAQPVTVPSTTTVDFVTMTDAQVWNTNGYDGFERSTITAGGISVRALWAGNSVHNSKVKYTGSGTDLPGILSNILTYPGSAGAYNFSNAYGYFIGDINLDGRSLYIGAGNDGAFILSNVLNYSLNNTRVYNYDLFLQQLP